MRLHLYALTFAMSIAGMAVQHPARSEEYRGTVQQQMACTPDVWRLCFDQIPDVSQDHGVPAAKHPAAFRSVPRGV